MKTNRTFAIALAALVHHRGLPLRDSDPGGGPRVNAGAGLYLADLVHTVGRKIRSSKSEIRNKDENLTVTTRSMKRLKRISKHEARNQFLEIRSTKFETRKRKFITVLDI